MSKAKSKEKRVQDATAAEVQKAILQTFDEDFAAVGKLQDPAEKLLKLEKIKNDIDAVTVRTNEEIRSRSITKFFALYLSIGGGSAGIIGLVAFAHIAAPLITLLTVPAISVGSYVGSRRAAKAKERLTEACSEFFATLETQKAQAATLSETLVKTELPTIARSGKFKDLLDVLPSLRDQCAAAFSKQASAQEGNVVVEQRKPTGKSLTL